MMNHIIKQPILSALLLSVLTCLVGVSSVNIPFMMIFMFFVAAPLTVIVRCHGLPYAVLSLMLSTAVLSYLVGLVNAAVLIMMPGMPALITGVIMNYKKPVYMTLLGAFLTTILMYTFIMSLIQASIQMPIRDIIRAGLQSAAENNSMQGMLFGASGEQATAAINASLEYAWMLVPAALILWSFAAALLNYIIASKILAKTGKPVPMLPPLREFRLPKSVLPGTLLILILTMAVTYSGIVDSQMITANIMILIQFTFAAQGLALLFFIFYYYCVHAIFRIILVVILLLNNMGVILLMMVGILDLVLNFRKRLVESRKK